MQRHAALVLAGVVSASLAVAQTVVIRTLPDNAKRGYLSHVQENVLSLDGQQVRLAPGGQIRGQNNLIVMPAALPPNALVKYQLDQNGNLANAWILTPEEAAAPDKTNP